MGTTRTKRERPLVLSFGDEHRARETCAVLNRDDPGAVHTVVFLKGRWRILWTKQHTV